jgi:hypothetical protein
MFVMMNAARLHVALQGIGLLDAAWQKPTPMRTNGARCAPPARHLRAVAPRLPTSWPSIRPSAASSTASAPGSTVPA